MKSFYHPLTAISAMSVMLCSLTSPAIASETWQGSGQIVSGSGRGGSVTLALTKTGNRVRFHSGPDQGRTVALSPANSVQTSSGNWQFADCGDYSEKLCVTFNQNQPTRVIRYLLTKSR